MGGLGSLRKTSPAHVSLGYSLGYARGRSRRGAGARRLPSTEGPPGANTPRHTQQRQGICEVLSPCCVLPSLPRSPCRMPAPHSDLSIDPVAGLSAKTDGCCWQRRRAPQPTTAAAGAANERRDSQPPLTLTYLYLAYPRNTRNSQPVNHGAQEPAERAPQEVRQGRPRLPRVR